MKVWLSSIIFAAMLFVGSSSFALDDTVYQRVMKSGEIRCGYVVAEPYFMIDMKTGTKSGIYHDYMEALGKVLGLKIVWAQETGLGDFPTALDAGRIDVMCLGVWNDPNRARAVDFVTPVAYNGPRAFVRADDYRFDGDLSKINSPDVTITYIDGDVGSLISADDFPQAKVLSLPQMTDVSMALDNVSSGKADVVFYTSSVIDAYNRDREEKLREVSNATLVRSYAEALAVQKNAHEFRRMLTNVTHFLIDNGTIDNIIRKYDPERRVFHPVARGYKVTGN